MTDTRMMALAFAVLAPLSVLLLSNSRVTDAKERFAPTSTRCAPKSEGR
jgi:hypothetical protein